MELSNVFKKSPPWFCDPCTYVEWVAQYATPTSAKIDPSHSHSCLLVYVLLTILWHFNCTVSMEVLRTSWEKRSNFNTYLQICFRLKHWGEDHMKLENWSRLLLHWSPPIPITFNMINAVGHLWKAYRFTLLYFLRYLKKPAAKPNLAPPQMVITVR